MKVAIVAYGHADNVLCLASNLTKYADVTLIFVASGRSFTRSIFDWDISGLPYGVTCDAATVGGYLGDRILEYMRADLRVCLARTPSETPFRDWRMTNYRHVKKLAQFILDGSFDVVHFNGSSGLHFYLNSLLASVPRVYTIHDYLPHTGDTNLKGYVANTLLNFYFTRCKYEFIQHYEYLNERFRDFYRVSANNVHTVHCGPLDVYRSFVQKEVTEEPCTVLSFGRISVYKGIEYLLRAATIIKKKIPKIKIVVAGKGKLWFDHTDMPLAEFHNYHVSNEEMVELIQRATIVATPYTDATHSAVIMTALAFNKPVVATAVGGFPEVIKDGVTGRLVPPKDAEALAAAIAGLLEHSGKRYMMKNNISRLVNEGKFSWDTIAKKTIGVYTKAVERQRR